MAIKIQCPGCSNKVVAEESDRGKSIKCGTCWTNVSIPAGEGPAGTGSAPVARPTARLVATAVPAKPTSVTATPYAGTPVVATVVKASPVVAVPAIAAPVLAKPAVKVDRKKSKEKPRFRERGRTDDEEDDDDSPRHGKKKGSTGMMIGLGVVAVVLLAGCGGIGWVIYDQSKTSTAGTSPTDGSPDPGANTGKPNNWRQIGLGDGFAMDTPNGEITKSDAKVIVGTESLDAKKYVQKDNASSIQITAVHCDLTKDAARKFDHTAMMLGMFAMPSVGPAPRGPRFIGEREAREYAMDRAGTHTHMWIARVGDRAYGFQFQWANPEPSGVLGMKEAFFRSLRITYNGGVETFEPVPWNGGGPVAQPQVPAPIDEPWVAFVNAAGFKAEAPKGVETEKLYADRLYPKIYNGRRFSAEDKHCTYWAFTHDLPDVTDAELQTFLNSLTPFSHGIKTVEDTKFDGKPATKWVIQYGRATHGISVRVGFRVFTFIVSSKNHFTNNKPDPTYETRSEKFFKSIKIAFDPKKYDPFADEPAWTPMAKTVGFTAQAPKGTSVAEHRIGFGKDEIKGTEFKCEDDGVVYQAFAYDLPAGKSIDHVVTGHLNRQPITEGPTSLTIDGYAAEELTYQDHFKLPIVMRSLKVGNRAIVAKVSKKFGGRVSEMEFAARKVKFLANFHIGAAGGTTATPAPGEQPKPGGNGEFVKAAKILPFWTAVVLPEAKELIAISIRDAGGVKPSGVLRRYGYPDFKLKATYQLPLPVNRVVADEKSGRLYCATVNVFDKAFLERELSFAPGDIQVFSLNKILDGKLADLEDLKPMNTIPIGTRMSGLEISPKDSLLYVSSILQGRDKGKIIWKGKLYKVEPDKQKIAAELDMPDAIWSVRLSADGSKLYAAGMPVSPSGSPLLGIARPTNVEVIDTASFKRTKGLGMPGAILEIALAGDRVLGVVSSKAEPSLLAVDEVAEVADVTPRGEIMEGARYIRTSPDGTKALVSGGFDSTNASYHEVVTAAPPRLVKIAGGNVVDALPLGGHFVFSPEGKYAIFNTGVILDLDKTSGK